MTIRRWCGWRRPMRWRIFPIRTRFRLLVIHMGRCRAERRCAHRVARRRCGIFTPTEVMRALVEELDDHEFGVAWQARQSLEMLTGQDFRYDSKAWLNYLAGRMGREAACGRWYSSNSVAFGRGIRSRRTARGMRWSRCGRREFARPIWKSSTGTWGFRASLGMNLSAKWSRAG